MTNRDVLSGPPEAAATKCAECPVHLLGRQTLLGAAQGVLGGAICGSAAWWLPAWGQPLTACPLDLALLWTCIAGLAGAGAGLALGLARRSLAGPLRPIATAGLLLAASGIAADFLSGETRLAPAHAALGDLAGVPVGLLGLLFLPRRVPTRAPAGRRVLGAGLACWGLTVVGALKVADIPGDFGESLCGVWGCLPPRQALVAMHLLWLVLFVPPAVVAGLRLSPVAAIRLGLLVAMGSAVVAVCVVGLDVARWLSLTTAEFHGYAGRHALYSLAVHTDVPMAQAVLAGLLCWGVASRSDRRPALGGRSVSKTESSGGSGTLTPPGTAVPQRRGASRGGASTPAPATTAAPPPRSATAAESAAASTAPSST